MRNNLLQNFVFCIELLSDSLQRRFHHLCDT
jgi:hypothetical protein